jgi:hypothetical protein
MRNVADKFVEEIKAHIVCGIIFFNENLAVFENLEKYFIA